MKNIGNIGMFIITKESGVSAGVRRIEAVCSLSAYNYFKEMQVQNQDAKEEIKNKDIQTGIKKLTIL